MAKGKEKIFEVACPDCAAMLRIDAATGLVVSHTSAPRKRMFEDLETAAKAMREQDERKESIFQQLFSRTACAASLVAYEIPVLGRVRAASYEVAEDPT